MERDISALMLDGMVEQPPLPERFTSLVRTYKPPETHLALAVYHKGPPEADPAVYLYRYSLREHATPLDRERELLHPVLTIQPVIGSFEGEVEQARDKILGFLRKHPSEAFFDTGYSGSVTRRYEPLTAWYFWTGLTNGEYDGMFQDAREAKPHQRLVIASRVPSGLIEASRQLRQAGLR